MSNGLLEDQAKSPYTRLLSTLGYLDSENYVTEPRELGHSAHLLEAVRPSIRGAYTFRTSPGGDHLLSPRPAVYVAEARNETDARQIHRSVWNQGAVPFLLTILPDQVRVYTGFSLTTDGEEDILAEVGLTNWAVVAEALSAYFASEIDSGALWGLPEHIQPQERVDTHLLRNLRALGDHLVHEMDLPTDIAHSLIGKFIYIRYLADRRILTAEWLDRFQIDLDSVLGERAGLRGLRHLDEVLQDRFNGAVFPLPLSGPNAPPEHAVDLVARVFGGMDLPAQQLSLDFDVYDFSYIPIELLSSIYEQFLHVEGKGAASGAYYTPEPLAEYLLAELDSERPLEPGMRVLDPSCGSGVFLVLAYRRLIEAHRSRTGQSKLAPEELRFILEGGIFGVERNREACYVAEFSLILTLLGYVEPPDLHYNDTFEFPVLHNRNIFECDFFDPQSSFVLQHLTFDWIVGNPPWRTLKPSDSEKHLRRWLEANEETRPVAAYRTSEAFIWRVTDFVSEEGMIALLFHATSLTNATSRDFRQAFFTRHEVRRITNFSNLAYLWFAGSSDAPAATLVFRPAPDQKELPSIVHYGPFVANQVLTRDLQRARPFAITVFEDEITTVAASDAAAGDGKVWKLAMWGSHRDDRILSRLEQHLRTTIGDLERRPGWSLSLGLQLRSKNAADEEIQKVPELRGQYVLDHKQARARGARFSVPEDALAPIHDDFCYVRKGRTSGVRFLSAPHVWITAEFAAFSERDFVLRHPMIGLAAGEQDSDHLRALCVYLNSSLATYLGFFESASWGLDRRRLGLNEVRQIRAPKLDEDQIRGLASLHCDIVRAEASRNGLLTGRQVDVPDDLRAEADRAVFDALGISASIATVVRDFVHTRLRLDKGKAGPAVTDRPTAEMLLSYGRCLRNSLDEYARLRHRIVISPNPNVVVCRIDLADSKGEVEPVLIDGKTQTSGDYAALWAGVRQRRSQWVYVQRSLKVFDGERVLLFKPALRLYWTCSEAMLDCDDIIAEVIQEVGFGR